MDCSLSTWPSIAQFDDFSWIKLGDIDSLENLDGALDPENELDGESQERKTPLSSNTMPSNTSPDFYSLSPCESLGASRWESINSLDLATALDNSFPPSVDTSSNSTALDGFDLYDTSENLIQHGGQQGGGHVNDFMVDSPSVLGEVNPANLGPGSNISYSTILFNPAVLSLSNIDDVKHASNSGSSASINCARSDAPMINGRGCKVEMDMYNSVGTSNVMARQSFNSCQFSHRSLPSRASASNLMSQPALDVNDMVLLPQPKYTTTPDTTLQWPQPNIRSFTFNAEKVAHNGFPVQTARPPATLNGSVGLANVASISSELKCSRAEASRARRRAASQRRAKKYPLQRLIRMSSLSCNARDKSDQKVVAMAVQSQLPIVSQGQFPAGTPSLPSNMCRQMPTFLPVVLQAPPFTQSLPNANSLKGGPFGCYQQQLSMAPDEDKQLSSGSSVVQPLCMDQNMPSVTGIYPVPLSHTQTTTPTMPLDAALLEQLQSTLNKMTVERRLCIRDSLYRLARNAKQRHTHAEVVSGSDASASQSEVVETNTNSIDRWIVNILFCKQPNTEASNISNNLSQNWDSCGSTINVRETSLHATTGL